MIIVAAPSKPFAYTAKGTARRGAIINDYEEEIRSLYTLLDEVTTGIAPPSKWTSESSLEYVRAVVHSIMTNKVEDEQDLFQWGCDRSVTSTSSGLRVISLKTFVQFASDVDPKHCSLRPA